MKRLLAVLLIITLCAAFPMGCTQPEETSESQQPSATETAIVIGTGGTAFMLEVTDDNGETETFRICTDEKTVGDALVKAELVEGETSEMGLMIKTVNGLRADWELDKAYWAFTIDGEFAVTGVSDTEINTDSIYALVYTPV